MNCDIICSTACRNVSRKPSKRTSLYSIEFSPQTQHHHSSGGETARCAGADSEDESAPAVPISPKPMTPRRVKRRSVMQRGTTSRHSSSSRRSTNRSSGRNHPRPISQNPVTRLLDQQLQQQWNGQSVPLPPPSAHLYRHNGHTNPTYQQSSSQSLNEPDELDELYNNRPASVRSSYSNFHGTRALHAVHAHAHYYHNQQPQSQATPQVPTTHARHGTFIGGGGGPPAYTSAVNNDSETTM